MDNTFTLKESFVRASVTHLAVSQAHRSPLLYMRLSIQHNGTGINRCFIMDDISEKSAEELQLVLQGLLDLLQPHIDMDGLLADIEKKMGVTDV